MENLIKKGYYSMADVSKKARIMLIVPMLDQGGLERVCALTAQLLKTAYDVHLVVFNTAGMIYDVSGVHLIDLQLGAVPGKAGKLLNVFKRVKRVRRLKKELDIQISYSFGQTANIVNVLTKVKDVTWAGIRGYGALEDKKEMSFVCRRADRMVSCTKVMEADIAAEYPVKSSAALYNPCNLEEITQLAKEPIQLEFEVFLQRPGKTVVSMGRAHDVKGFWHLMKSVALIRQKGQKVKLMFIGAGDFSEYKELARNLAMEQDVLFTGVQKNPFALLARADIYALTSESEGFPNALIEAMACGLPCVSVNCKTGPAEILQADYRKSENQSEVYHGDYGILTPVLKGTKNLEPDEITQEEEVFAGELEKLLTDHNMWMTYREKGKKRAADFGMEAYAAELEQLIQKDTH